MAGAAVTGQSNAVSMTAGWVRSRRFDLAFQVLPCLLALAFVLVTQQASLSLVMAILLFQWVAGGPHIIATFTRTCLDAQSRRQYWFLVFVLPVICAALALGLAFGVGMWAIGSAYFYWQSWHFLRQSYGVERIYARAAEPLAPRGDWPTLAVIYALPIAGVLRRSHQAVSSYLGQEIRWMPVNENLMQAATLALLAILGWWVFARVREWRAGTLRPAHTLYMFTHVVMFTGGYMLLENPDMGWLLISIWHSLQYLMIVWLFNARRTASPVAPQRGLWRRISLPRNWFLYALFVLVVAAIVGRVFPAIQAGADMLAMPQPWLIAFALGMAVNFHHYTVDAFIWRSRRAKARAQTAPAAP